jgi:HD-like signal output (HDOD) protein
MPDLKALVRSVEDLEPLSPSAMRLASSVAKDEADLDEIREIVSLDPALTLRLLRAANSVANAGARPVVEIKEALLRLGTGTVLSLAISGCVRDRLMDEQSSYGLAEGALWRHSVAAALTAELLPRFTRTRVPPESVSASLLHDIGKVVLSRFLEPEVLREIHQAQLRGDQVRLEAERMVLGMHHGEVGKLIAEHWRLPEPICAAVHHHHTPELGGGRSSYVACLANAVAQGIECTDGMLGTASMDADRVHAELGLKPEAVMELRQKVEVDLAEVRKRYS